MSGRERLAYNTPLLRSGCNEFFLNVQETRHLTGVKDSPPLDLCRQPGLQYHLGIRRKFAELESHPEMGVGINDCRRRLENLCFGVNLQTNGSPTR